MKACLILASTFMVVLYEGVFCQSIRSDYVLLNQPYTFPGNASGCHHAEWRKRPPIDTTIATYENHACMTERGFQEEFTCKDIHLLLNSAKYTDQGPYQFICDGDKTPVNLDVLYAQNASAVEMDNITLNCYAHNAEDVTWLHNNESVLLYKLSGSMKPSKDYEGRASLEKNCFKTGDLSLTIACVRKEDAGIYRCFVGDGTTKGYPHAYLLHVNEKRSGPEDQTHSCCIFYKDFTIGLVVILGISVAAFVIYLITFKLRERQSTSATATQNSEDEANEREHMLMSAISTSTPTTESQPVDNHPVQESNFTGNKSSNTMPF